MDKVDWSGSQGLFGDRGDGEVALYNKKNRTIAVATKVRSNTTLSLRFEDRGDSFKPCKFIEIFGPTVDAVTETAAFFWSLKASKGRIYMIFFRSGIEVNLHSISQLNDSLKYFKPTLPGGLSYNT